MSSFVRPLTAGAAATALAWLTVAQDAPGERPTVGERLAALETAVATLDARLNLERTRPGENTGQTDAALAGRVTALERSIERLTADLQRAERLADGAARAAADAQREAQRAQQAARDAAMRR
jgi:hypothetical protein